LLLLLWVLGRELVLLRPVWVVWVVLLDRLAGGRRRLHVELRVWRVRLVHGVRMRGAWRAIRRGEVRGHCRLGLRLGLCLGLRLRRGSVLRCESIGRLKWSVQQATQRIARLKTTARKQVQQRNLGKANQEVKTHRGRVCGGGQRCLIRPRGHARGNLRRGTSGASCRRGRRRRGRAATSCGVE
jgi:hypothetical protein